MLYDLEQKFDSEPDAIIEADDVGHALQARVVPVLKHHYANFISDVPEANPVRPRPPTCSRQVMQASGPSSWISIRTD